jgi:hypothetical protein
MKFKTSEKAEPWSDDDDDDNYRLQIFFQNKDQHCNNSWNTAFIVIIFWFYRS